MTNSWQSSHLNKWGCPKHRVLLGRKEFGCIHLKNYSTVFLLIFVPDNRIDHLPLKAHMQHVNLQLGDMFLCVSLAAKWYIQEFLAFRIFLPENKAVWLQWHTERMWKMSDKKTNTVMKVVETSSTSCQKAWKHTGDTLLIKQHHWFHKTCFYELLGSIQIYGWNKLKSPFSTRPLEQKIPSIYWSI